MCSAATDAGFQATVTTSAVARELRSELCDGHDQLWLDGSSAGERGEGKQRQGLTRISTGS